MIMVDMQRLNYNLLTMQDLERKALDGQDIADGQAKVGDKRKKTGKAAGKNKRAKNEETGKTQVKLTCRTTNTWQNAGSAEEVEPRSVMT